MNMHTDIDSEFSGALALVLFLRSCAQHMYTNDCYSLHVKKPVSAFGKLNNINNDQQP